MALRCGIRLPGKCKVRVDIVSYIYTENSTRNPLINQPFIAFFIKTFLVMRLSPENVLRPNAMNGEIISMDSSRLLFVWNISQIFT